jgi:hypothetical protein
MIYYKHAYNCKELSAEHTKRLLWEQKELYDYLSRDN